MEHKWLFILNLRSAIMLGLSTLLVSGSLFHTALGSPSPDDPHGIGFVTDAATWETIVEKAQKDDKPIFVDVYTAWCGPCKWMDQHVFNQREVGDYMNRIFINVKVDAEKGWGPEFKARFGVAAYPTYLFFSPEGDMVFSSGGSKPTMHFLADARHAIDNWQAGISSRGMEELLKNENADPARLKVYLDRLGGQDPRTSFLLDLYLTSLPEDSLTTSAILKLVRDKLTAPVNLQSKAFSILLQDYLRKPIRNLNMRNFDNSWLSLRTKLLGTLEVAGKDRDEAVLEGIIRVSDRMYPSGTAILYRDYYQSIFYALSGQESKFMESFERFLTNVYRPDRFEYLLTQDEQEYQHAVDMETKTAAPRALSPQETEALKSHAGIIWTSVGLLQTIVHQFASAFPESYTRYEKGDLDRAIRFTNKLYASNRVAVYESFVKRHQKFLEEYKDLGNPFLLKKVKIALL